MDDVHHRVGRPVIHLLMCFRFCCSVERDRLRERERQARAQMSSQVADQESPGTSGNFLFREPIRVSVLVYIFYINNIQCFCCTLGNFLYKMILNYFCVV